ncbi:adaptin N terminal region-domain-containing protein [Suillus subalutaceus]|uniref:adaptin N terminal region-domain-containing protein n=1 Tax=Suillus subalutaceus TaxID=48586 RepID=UPI001B882373|nr:adaptin N terminal region-domain-containing protein [Suillus subalutaceus]KAG1868262.1 adaptin N terminal region-domain-containing protein [Suillus subalutaceus]
MWERTLQDLIRGLRANKNDESKFIGQAMDEIRREIKSKDMALKAGAVMKLTYLDMLGYDMSWASFHIVEVMSSPKIHIKSVGYLGAVQSFNEDTDVLMLTTNLLKKDLSSTPADVAVTLNGVSSIMTADLARDLSPELVGMLNHSRPHIRKRAVAAMYRVFQKYPDALHHGIGRLQEKLEDSDPGVVCATVNVLCELARRNPQDYLPLAPQLFHLLTTSSNNWMLIKIVKLFGSLSPHEPRLVKETANHRSLTSYPRQSAISLLYECVHTCIIGNMLQGNTGDSLARTCDPDQNLKYIALLAMVKIVPTHPHLVAEHQDTILSSVDDEDISIRMRALDLLSALVNRDNLQSIVQQVLSHLVKPESSAYSQSAVQSLSQHIIPSTPAKSPGAPSQSTAYRLVLSQRIMTMCSQNTYDNVIDFEWYLSVLVDLAYVSNVDIGTQIRDQLVDVVGRVRAARSYAVKLMVKVLSDDTFLLHAGEQGSCSEVLWAAAWICGEYCGELSAPDELIPYLLQPEIASLRPDITAVCIQSATKLFGYWASEAAKQWTESFLEDLKKAVDIMIEQMEQFASSTQIEVQERAANVLQLLIFIKRDVAMYKPKQENGFSDPSTAAFDPVLEPTFPKSLYLIQPLFSSHELNPVASIAQASVAVPEGLDLDAWIVPSMQDRVAEEGDDGEVTERKIKRNKKGKEKESASRTKVKSGKKKQKEGHYQEELAPQEEETAEEKAERERLKAERLERMRDDPYYIVDDRPQKPPAEDVDSIPVVRLDGPLPLPEEPRLPGLRSSASIRSTPPSFVVERGGEMPAGIVITPQPSTPVPSSRRQTPNLFDVTATPPPPLPSFQSYEVPDDELRTSTPEPIKVTRAKKKGTSTAKKKRTVKPEMKAGDESTVVIH